MLKINNLHVSVDNKKILKGINLAINKGELHILMGPNGAGKTSLVMTLAGDSRYQITKGNILFDGKDITKLSPDRRAKLGLFVSFQKPVEIPGVSIRNILRRLNKKEEFENQLEKVAGDLKINEELLTRSFEDFSGGERKKLELLQAKILKPHYLVLDEIDSGLDFDSLKLLAENLKKDINFFGILLITHYPRLLKFIKPTCIHVLIRGNIVKSDGQELLEKIEKKGYQWLLRQKI